MVKHANHCVNAHVSYVWWFRSGGGQLIMLRLMSVLYGESTAAEQVVDVARTCEQRRG